MRCNKCGNQLRDGATYCNRCGAPVEDIKPAVSDVAEKSVSGKRRVIVIVSVIAVVTAAIALAVFLMLSDDVSYIDYYIWNFPDTQMRIFPDHDGPCV